MARLGPSRSAILPTLLRLACFPSRVCPTIVPSSPSCRYPSRIRRIHHSLGSRVTLYLFRAPSDRPSAVCTESTWSFRWDLTARGRRERGSTGTYMSDTYMSRDREKERESERPPSFLFAVDLHRSILHFRRFRLRESYRRYVVAISIGLFWFPAGRLRSWTFSSTFPIFPLRLTDRLIVSRNSSLRISMFRNTLVALTFRETDGNHSKFWSNYSNIRLIMDRF